MLTSASSCTRQKLSVGFRNLYVGNYGYRSSKIENPDQVFYIYYLVQFKKDKDKYVLALLNSESELNAITLAYAAQLGLKVQKTNVGVQKIEKFSLETYGIGIATFEVLNKLGFSRFF